MNLDPRRAIVGYARSFGTPVLGDGRILGDGPEAYAAFLAVATGVQLRWNHGPLITSRGLIEYPGMWRRFAVPDPGSLGVRGLLALGEVSAGELGDALLDTLARDLDDPRPNRIVWGLSIGVNIVELDGYDGRQFWPFEVSVTSSPADRNALVFAVGERAVEVWNLLCADDPVTGRRVSMTAEGP